MRPVTVTYSLTADQFMVACNALWSHQAIGKNGNLIIAVVLVVATGISLISAPSAAFLLAPATLFFAAAGPLRDWLWRRHYATLVKYSGPITVTFAPDTIEFQSAEGAFTHDWAVFDSFTDTPRHIFLHVSTRKARGQFSIIPKSALAAPGDLAALQALLAMRLRPRTRRWL